MFRTKVVEKIKTHIFLCPLNLKKKNRVFFEKMWEKYCRACQAACKNVTHAYCMLYN